MYYVESFLLPLGEDTKDTDYAAYGLAEAVLKEYERTGSIEVIEQIHPVLAQAMDTIYMVVGWLVRSPSRSMG